jgi:hypothetical protein
MTNYDKLIDSIAEEIYFVWQKCEEWDEENVKKKAHKILQMVEEFQSKRVLDK